ncbi:MAG TPA: tRNA uridine(34) 5-carboxymethylaminomethyl modification radical SAM/GNAT enzyme Elp3 [Candidatus Nanoarchaeia archaeon]|nr:tRNA uridine(34) 5-carboxymethylaminomethyl modification radical SAM/GNAT enzyme Elp3 [Candidatus Pacearchaeota archaeon]HLC73286.1 tRNA uridine(34) 5-carboxymethylaminomethyl modification radical SAM/GNAT enzyme Elp3 [Candidatus Nanoarchaeia archaeon]
MAGQSVYSEINENLEDGKILNKFDLNKLKLNLVKKFKSDKIPSNIEILEHLNGKDIEKFKHLFTSKPIRTLSGVAPIAVMTMAIACKHGKCTFCPGGPNSYYGNVPMSYTGNEPSTMRALRANYDPYLIVFNRLEQYILLNQVPEKTEVIIQGGTFTSFDENYQDYVIKFIFKAFNDFSEIFFRNGSLDLQKFNEFFELPGNVSDENRTKKIQKRILRLKNDCNLIEEQKKNETSKIRCVALTIETKPDWCKEKEINKSLELGATRVELGVQTLYDDILKITNRGHNLNDTIEAIQLLKDSFLKTNFHIMPGLPNSDRDKDLNVFKELFENQLYRPDQLKIYPCMVMPGTPLYLQYKKGLFKPLTTSEAAEVIAEGKKYVEKYCRIVRCQRDIPTKVTEAGVDKTNLRQYIKEELIKKGIKCKCIRCKEPMGKNIDFNSVNLLRKDYESSNGEEVFLSCEDTKNDILIGFVRLRKPYKPFREEITNKSVGIRELHVYGSAVSIGKKASENELQHRGYGIKLMNEAEKIAKEEFDANKILVISGIGVKEYFKNKLNYKYDGVYMSKKL